MAGQMIKIKIPYTPRPYWEGANGIHAQLDRHRFSVIVAHRRFGKTMGVINQLIKRAIIFPGTDGRFGYLAPYRNQAKAIAWDYLKRYTQVVPDVKFNESELAVTMPNGSRIRLYGADNADALRGLYFDGLVVDEIADIKPDVWGEILRPALADRGGWCIFIGTPKGQNVFFELYQKALAQGGWFAGLYRADQTQVLPEEELQALKDELSDNQYRQELLCDFTARTDDSLIGLECVMAAEKRCYSADEIRYAPLVFGLDVARFGGDTIVLSRRRGLILLEQKRYRPMDNMALAGQVSAQIHEHEPDAVFVDAGRGEGVIDRLRQLGHDNIIEVNFGGTPINQRYANKRAEMWAQMGEWLQTGQIMPDQRLRQELTTPTYSFDEAGRLKLEAKEKIKERIGYSPDGADSLALTFAFPVLPRDMRRPIARYDRYKNL